MRVKWVLKSSSATQRHPARSGSCELPVWLGDPRVCWAGGSLHFVMSRDRADGDPVHLGFDMWGSTETSIALRGRLIMLLLRVMIDNGGVDISIMEMSR